MRQRVVIVGGGVAGLSAAHELAERDFEVHVYERRPHFGGKAASVRRQERAPGRQETTDVPARHRVDYSRDVPGEHGFRFYPGWYQHLPDTMKRIPYKGRREFFQGASVFDNLVAADSEQLTWYDRDQIDVLAHAPRNLPQALSALSTAGRFRHLGLAPGEVAFFVRKLVEFLATPESKRIERFDQMTWWDYLEADRKSQAFRDLIAATTRTMVAAKARQVSAYSIANMAIRTLFDLSGTVDRVLNGPTNEVWIEPWVEYLKGRGVTFHPNEELDSISFDPARKLIARLEFVSQLREGIDRLRRSLRLICAWRDTFAAELLIPIEPYVRSTVEKALRGRAADMLRDAQDIVEEAKVVHHVAELAGTPAVIKKVTEAKWQAVAAVAPALEEVAALASDAAKAALALADRLPAAGHSPSKVDLFKEVEKARAAVAARLTKLSKNADLDTTLADAKSALPKQTQSGQNGKDDEDAEDDQDGGAASRHPYTHYIFALPLEQMAYHVNRSPMLTYYDPSLRNLILLAEHTEWMAGIQFYFKTPIDLGRGHMVCIDSEWSLTAIEETQYWREVELPTDIKAVLSVDIAAWDRKGRFNLKEAFNCTNAEVATEVWQQLKQSVNRDARAPKLDETMLRGDGPADPASYYLDDSIVNLLDRTKQGSYEKARSVRFSADELLRRQSEGGRETDSPYVWGRSLRFNVEPLLINRVGARGLRPEARTAIPNMFLAADYVRTGTDLACMESANEAARLAVNALLEAAGSTKPRCPVWGFSPVKDFRENLHAMARVSDRLMGVPGSGERAVAALTSQVGRFAGDLLTRWRDVNER